MYEYCVCVCVKCEHQNIINSDPRVRSGRNSGERTITKEPVPRVANNSEGNAARNE